MLDIVMRVSKELHQQHGGLCSAKTATTSLLLPLCDIRRPITLHRETANAKRVCI